MNIFSDAVNKLTGMFKEKEQNGQSGGVLPRRRKAHSAPGRIPPVKKNLARNTVTQGVLLKFKSKSKSKSPNDDVINLLSSSFANIYVDNRRKPKSRKTSTNKPKTKKSTTRTKKMDVDKDTFNTDQLLAMLNKIPTRSSSRAKKAVQRLRY